MLKGLNPNLGELVLNNNPHRGMCSDLNVIPPGVGDENSIKVIRVNVIDHQRNDLIGIHRVR
jgi:hypothetical protein